MIGEGLTYEQHAIGATYRTLNRTVSETDIVNFVNLCGFTEPLSSWTWSTSPANRCSSVARRPAP